MELWERFTVRARRMVLIAHDEASQTRQPLIGTEHLLLGLLRLGEGTGIEVLRALDVNLGELRADVTTHIEMGSEDEFTKEISFTPEAQRVLQLAYAEARQRKDRHIGTEHILLGLLAEGRGAAYGVLDRHGVCSDDVRSAIDEVRQVPVGEDVEPTAAGTAPLEQFREPRLTVEASRALQLAQEKSGELGDEHIGTEHILLALVELEDCIACRILDDEGVDRDRLRRAISQREGREPPNADAQD